MSSKILVAALLLSGIGLVFTASVDARGRGRCGCGGETYYTETVQASDGSRVYSYEPSNRYYMGRGTSSRSNVPLYLLPKSDPRKYDAR